MPEQPTRFRRIQNIFSARTLTNIISSPKFIKLVVMASCIIWLLIVIAFPSAVKYDVGPTNYGGVALKWIIVFIVAMFLMLIPGVLSEKGVLPGSKIFTKENYGITFLLAVIFVLFTLVSRNISDILEAIRNSEDLLRDAYDALVKNNEGHAPFAWAALFLTTVFIVITSRTYWWFATAIIGIIVASFILIVPPLFENIPLNKMNWVVNILVIAASGVVLPFIAAKEIGTIAPGGMNRSTLISVGIKSLAVPGLVFAFISSTNLNTYTPKNETNGTEENATGSIENIIDGHHYVFQGQLHIELNDGLEGNIIIGGLSKSSKALAFELG